jgi:predicted O-methyltransferase YrrM
MVDPDRVRGQEWRRHPYHPERFAGIRSMLVEPERRMLYWLSHHATGAGCLIDAGAFLGGSTAYLADGIVDHRDPAKKVHSFDLFEVSDYAREHFDLEGVQSTFPIYAANVTPWAERIVVYPGDITRSGWQPQPIDILFLDCLKSASTNDWVTRRFFPSLTEGSIVIQQDFLHPHLPWIHVTMGYYHDHFDYLADAGDSAIFACRRPFAISDVRGYETDALPAGEQMGCFDRATERFAGHPLIGRLRRAREKLERRLAARTAGAR